MWIFVYSTPIEQSHRGHKTDAIVQKVKLRKLLA